MRIVFLTSDSIGEALKAACATDDGQWTFVRGFMSRLQIIRRVGITQRACMEDAMVKGRMMRLKWVRMMGRD